MHYTIIPKLIKAFSILTLLLNLQASNRIDIGYLYLPEAKWAHGGHRGLKSELFKGFSKLNQAHNKSHTDLYYQVVAIDEVYTGQTGKFRDTNLFLRLNTPYMDYWYTNARGAKNVRELRRNRKIDFIHIIIDRHKKSNWRGSTYLYHPVAVLNANSISSDTGTHEMGHQLGLKHHHNMYLKHVGSNTVMFATHQSNTWNRYSNRSQYYEKNHRYYRMGTHKRNSAYFIYQSRYWAKYSDSRVWSLQ